MKLIAINKTEKKFLINIPGLTKEDIAVRVENRTIFINKKTDKKLPEGWSVLENEFLKEIQDVIGPFTRSFIDSRTLAQIQKSLIVSDKLQFTLDYTPKVSDIKAVVENGQLTLTIPEIDSGQEIIIE